MIKRLLRLIIALQIYLSVELLEEEKGFFGSDLYFVMCSQLYLNIHLFIFKIFDKKASCNKGPLSAIPVPEILEV